MVKEGLVQACSKERKNEKDAFQGGEGGFVPVVPPVDWFKTGGSFSHYDTFHMLEGLCHIFIQIYCTCITKVNSA